METTKKTSRSRRTPEQARELLAEQQRTGASDEEFARQKGIAVSTLRRWRQRKPPSSDPRWVEVNRPSSGMAAGPMAQVRWGDGLCIHLNGGFDVDRIAGLIERLRLP